LTASRRPGHGRSSVHLPIGSLWVNTGLIVSCPAAGPACTLKGAWSVSDYPMQQRHASGGLRQRIRPGTQRVITFGLNPKAAALLRKHKQLLAEVSSIVSAGRQGTVAQDFGLIVTR
jgi:hypothetical protein